MAADQRSLKTILSSMGEQLGQKGESVTIDPRTIPDVNGQISLAHSLNHFVAMNFLEIVCHESAQKGYRNRIT